MVEFKPWHIVYITGCTVVAAIAVMWIAEGNWLGALAGGLSGLAGGLIGSYCTERVRARRKTGPTD